jgi:ribosomal protein L9
MKIVLLLFFLVSSTLLSSSFLFPTGNPSRISNLKFSRLFAGKTTKIHRKCTDPVQVVLLQDVENVGLKDEILHVPPVRFLNYLEPRFLARRLKGDELIKLTSEVEKQRQIKERKNFLQQERLNAAHDFIRNISRKDLFYLKHPTDKMGMALVGSVSFFKVKKAIVAHIREHFAAYPYKKDISLLLLYDWNEEKNQKRSQIDSIYQTGRFLVTVKVHRELPPCETWINVIRDESITSGNRR